MIRAVVNAGRAGLFGALWLGLAACHPDPVVTTGPCDDVNEALGVTVCLHDIPDSPTWNVISGVGNTDDVERLASYMTPASDDAPLPTLFVNQNIFPLHYNMLTQAFPDLYAGLTWEEYGTMVTAGADRTYYAGDISQRRNSDGSVWYSFIVWENPADATTTPTLQQVTDTWTALTERFGLADLVYVPYTEAQEATAATWDNAPFTIRNIDDDVAYEPYTEATGYGTVRLYTLDALDAATVAGDYGYQDVLVLDQAPLDLERVVAGIATGTRQGALSHINVRAAARGTPNCYIQDPMAAFAAWEGQLVRFQCGAEDWSVSAATQEDAQAWWDAIRPDPVTIPTPDLDWDEPVPLLDLPTDTAADRAQNLTRFGSKGSNLGTLYQRIPPEYQLDGFVLPFAYYDRFMRGTTWTVDLGAGPETASFQDTLDVWLNDEPFRTDAAVRHARLDALRTAIESAPVDSAIVDPVVAEIRAVWGRDDVMVRFRSSSNAEDALEFSGAGLYTSESGCVADEVDGDDLGPSRCDADKDSERSVAAALTTVWASLWTMQAFEERDWYGIDHAQTAMGILVDTRLDDEQANVVAFTGNPSAVDDRYLVEAQIGAYDVVSAEAGVYPETSLVTVKDGDVSQILRVDTSSERAAGDWVLDDAQLTELSELFWDIAAIYPQDDATPDDTTVLWDTEWKVDAAGQLIIKQIRPFLRDDAALLGG